MEGLPFGLPTFPLLCLTSRMARAPKLSRRAKGVAGLLLLLDAGPPAGSSSKGLSSTEPELALDRLSVRCRGLKAVAWLGEPESPMVVRDSRRR